MQRCHCSISEFDPPKIHEALAELHAEIPAIWPARAFPDDLGVRLLTCDQVRDPKSLLQFHFPFAYEQTTIGVYNPRESMLKAATGGYGRPLYKYRYTTIQS